MVTKMLTGVGHSTADSGNLSLTNVIHYIIIIIVIIFHYINIMVWYIMRNVMVLLPCT